MLPLFKLGLFYDNYAYYGNLLHVSQNVLFFKGTIFSFILGQVRVIHKHVEIFAQARKKMQLACANCIFVDIKKFLEISRSEVDLVNKINAGKKKQKMLVWLQ